ncbi:DNA topoisomerase 4 subunit B [Sideroxyarcus emersonii]|uniref:DNA topoisomerase 4 subunit B n=1 Tax=Sideroxyarcus emersonii TaxID=2764705 RepID=A0AAN1XBM9_9PROT|nr:DNA topoisomerase IV subunit B [Sideroxyarcus emersonii]BCK88511.1 DNA topoisomerase 4 subunit B [Sideroxyarcus emersonii]
MATYNEASFKVLRGLEPVRQRPGMYTNLESPNHIIAEVVDNACDEALAGFAKNIFVTAHTDGSVSVKDDGRGIPVGIHKEEGRSVVEVAFTVLHSGGKFDKEKDGAYKFAGGLHGVGVAVTNALAKKVEVTVYREGGQHELRFVDGVAEKPLAKVGTCPKNQTGTMVRAWPNPKYFDSPNVNLAQLEFSLRSKAVLLPGVTITLHLEKSGETKSWTYPDGLRGYLAEALSEFELATPILLQEKFTRKGDSSGFAEGEGATWALTWSAEGNVVRESYVNLIPTPAGGTHEAGLRDGVFNAVKAFAEIHSLLPKGVKLVPEDVFSRASFVLSAKVLDPQFQGQTKEKLVSRDALRLVSSMMKDPLELWLNEHLEPAKKIVELAIQQAQARMRSAQKVEKKKGSSVAVLPGKLTDCSSSDSSRTELFLVEGDSAGGSAKQGRNKEFQAVLPLRGKVLNTFEVEKDRLFANNEIHDIAVAIGVDPHAPNEDVDLSGLRYNAILIMADADVDGSHISTLLLTLFYRHFYKVVEAGKIYIAQPPLFRIDVPAHGKKQAHKIYALNEAELTSTQDKLRKEKYREGSWSISRFKGLGEMSPEQLWETTLNPDTRRALCVKADAASYKATMGIFNMLMGKQEASTRRAWLEYHGNEVEADI